MNVASLFEIQAKEYEGFTFTAENAATTRLVVFGICIGIFLAALYTLYLRLVPGQLVRALLDKKANTPEAALSLDDVQPYCRGLVLAALAHNATLQRLVKIAPKKETEEGESSKGARYYIPEESTYRAGALYSKPANAVLQLVMTLIGCVLLAVLLCKLIPVALGMINAIL